MRVEFYKLQNDGTQKVIAICRLVGGQVEFSGDENLVNNLVKYGIRDYTNDKKDRIFPRDGQIFLEQLKYNFDSAYLQASDVKND